MVDETNPNHMNIIRSGYDRFFDESDDLPHDGNTVISVRRQQQITTHYGPNTTQNKIKISLSQEQIVNRMNGMAPGIKRSQSINIQKTLIASSVHLNRGQSVDINQRRSLLRRPSQIPVKVNEPLRICAPSGNPSRKSSSQVKGGQSDELRVADVEKPRILRKFSVPINRRSIVSENELTMSSLPLATTQSINLPYNIPEQRHDIRSLLPKKFKCRICLNAFSDPRVLDCLHTFCLECLFGIESQSRSMTSKVNLVLQQSESSEIDVSSSLNSHSTDVAIDSKENNRIIRSSISVISTNPIRKFFSSAIKKRPEERKVSTTPQIKRRLSTVTEKNKTTIQCPICSFRTEISIGGVSRVPKDFLMERQMQDVLRKLEGQNLWNEFCSLCYEEIEAVGHCMNCQLNLCTICKEAHLRQRTTSKHNIINQNEIKSRQNGVNKEINTVTPKSILKCFVHPTQELKLYCASCDQVACHNCTILVHKGHKFEPMPKATKHGLKSFKESLERNQKFFNYVNDSISKLTNSVSKINQLADAIQNEIEQFLKNYFEALEAHKETLLRQIAKARETKHLSIMEQQEYLQKRANEAKDANLFAENLLQNGSDAEILVFLGTLQRRFEHCQKSKTSIDPKIPDAFQFLPEIRAPATQAQLNIPMYGIIATQVADPKFSTLEVDEPIILRIYRRAELRMISRDCDDRRLCHGGIVLNVDVKYKDASTKQVVAQVSDKRDGSYVIAFTPDAAGLMSLSIKIQDQDIKGSPFTLCIRTLRPHSGIFHCCTFCSSKGSKTMTCACDSKMPGGYIGCGHGHDGHPGKRHWSCCAKVLETSECSATNSFR